jgi:hypothetical protein
MRKQQKTHLEEPGRPSSSWQNGKENMRLFSNNSMIRYLNNIHRCPGVVDLRKALPSCSGF